MRDWKPTRHAVLRYLARINGASAEYAKQQMVGILENAEFVKKDGATGADVYRAGDVDFVVRGNVVITVLDKKEKDYYYKIKNRNGKYSDGGIDRVRWVLFSKGKLFTMEELQVYLEKAGANYGGCYLVQYVLRATSESIPMLEFGK